MKDKKEKLRLMTWVIIVAVTCAAGAVGFLFLENLRAAVADNATALGLINVLETILVCVTALYVVTAIVLGTLFANRISRRYHWYESLLDSIPFPISVTDNDMRWTFINKPVEDMLGVKRDDVLGKACENWNADICKTENCGIARLKKGLLQTQFHQTGMDFQVDTAYILDKKGKQIGHIEVVQDASARVKGASYSKREVDKLAKNLREFSEGNLKLDFSTAEADQYTIEEKKNFEEINTFFKRAVDSIAGYIHEITQHLDNLAKGDLSDEVLEDFHGEFKILKDSINNIYANINQVFTDINVSADQVAAGTRQVSDGSQAISMGATEQASAIEELTSTITQIATHSAQNAVNANQANDIATHAKNDAIAGNDKMRGMQQAMKEINESSESISKIIKVIDDIAFQTNILALNAAVEAARAGVHGKGFAVVAEEVRNLAAKSANAAKETTALIEGSIEKVATGTKIANDTAAALANIVTGVEKAVHLMGDIAESSSEQATGITQINRGIEQLSKVVQTNSATSEEAAAASQELSSQAEMLKSMISQFKLRTEKKKRLRTEMADQPKHAGAVIREKTNKASIEL